MTEELWKIITEWRNKGVHISDEEAGCILWYCNRKMDVGGIQSRDEYLPLLYADEVRSYLVRQYVNASTILGKIKETEENKCAAYV